MPELWTYVTRAAAIRILVDAIQNEHRGELPVNRALQICWSVGLNVCGGAILIRRPDGWRLMGYAYDGRDVLMHVDQTCLRKHPFRGEIMTPEAFEAKRIEFNQPVETKVRPRLRTQARTIPPSVEPAPVAETTISPRRLVSRTGKAAGFRPSRNRAGKWERYF